jgi:LmbE family N-acetylglucosaminyl deacetylase
MSVLVLAAHPDDEILGCGGTITRLARDKRDVYIAILGEGLTSRYDRRESADPGALNELQSRAEQAAKIVGAKDIFLYGLADNRFDSLDLLDVVKIVEELIKKVSPIVIYTHHGGDLNIDHRVINRAVLTATRPVNGQPVREVYAFEVPSSTEWSFQRFEPVFRPNYFVDISDTLETKLEAMASYQSEIQPFPHPRSPQALRVIAQRWGTVVGCAAAESFELIRAMHVSGNDFTLRG